MTTALVLFHKDCPDGFGAAYAAWSVLGESADYIPVDYRTPAPESVRGLDVFILDFAFPRAVLERMHAEARSLLVLDHHQSSADVLVGLPYCTFDMSKSGTGLSWAHFRPGEPLPRPLQHVQARDLWRWADSETEPFVMAIDCVPMTFSDWDTVVRQSQDDYAEMLREGRAMLKQFRSIAEGLCEKAVPCLFGGERGLMINASGPFNSLCGNILAEKSGTYGLVWKSYNRETVNVSLRSVGDYNLIPLAALLNGGGHKAACGIVTEWSAFKSAVTIVE